MKSILLSGFLFFVGIVNAQKPELNFAKLNRNDWGSIMRGNQALTTKKQSDFELRGSPFIYDNYEKGIIIVDDSLQAQVDFKIKFNAEDNEIWFLNEKNKELTLTDPRITGFDIIMSKDTHSFKKVLLPDLKTNPKRFVEVLYEGTNYALVKLTEKQFEAANFVDKGLVQTGRNYDAYLTSVSYYIYTAKKVYKKIALKKNDIYKVNSALVEKNREAINKFCKEQQIENPLEELDAIDLIDYLDGLK
jgi:PHD/YefM family antitoxin component YafN of YafNO toxin-antitoxin module